MAWQMSGQLIESCSCNMFCPCWFTVQELMIMDRGWCASAIAFRTRDGNSDGVPLGGRTVVFAVDFPGPTLFDGNGTARLYIDESASADQRRELEAICSGRKGARWPPLLRSSRSGCRPEARRLMSPTTARRSRSRSCDAGRLESRRLRDPQGQGFTLRGGGFVSGLGCRRSIWHPAAAAGPIPIFAASRRSRAPEANSAGAHDGSKVRLKPDYARFFA